MVQRNNGECRRDTTILTDIRYGETVDSMNFESFVQLVIQGVNMGLVYALMALAVSLIWNAAGIFNFAQGDLLTWGGYVMLTFCNMLGLPYYVSFISSLGMMAILGFLLSKLYFYPLIIKKANPHIILIGTVALSVIIKNSVLKIWGAQAQRFDHPFGNTPIHFGKVSVMPYQVANILIITSLVVLLQFFLRKSVTGIAMRAVAQNSIASSLMGVKVDQIVAITFSVSTILACIGGILISPSIPLTANMGGTLATKAFAAVLIGGLGSFSGAMVGGIFVGLSEVIFSSLFASTYKDVFTFTLMAIVLVVKPGGIFKAEISEKV